jgi:transcriptional regulator with XRE-family HTH domain
LSEIQGEQPIPLKTRHYFRRLLQNRLHQLVLQAFIDQEEREGLTQKQLAGRLEKAPEQINRWLHTAGNWEFDTLADLLLGMGVRLDELSVTPIADLIKETPNKAQRNGSPSAAPDHRSDKHR